MQIKDLTGLEKCKSLASLDLAKNQITSIAPLKDLKNIQYPVDIYKIVLPWDVHIS